MVGTRAAFRRRAGGLDGGRRSGMLTMAMKQAELIATLKSLRPQLEAEGVEHLALFGSRARGDNRPDSDIDLLVEVPEESDFSILNLIGVEHVVSDNVGLKANAVMRRSLRDKFRASIEPDILEIF